MLRIGLWKLVVQNRRSLRLQYIEHGVVYHCIVSRLLLKGFTMDNQKDLLPPLHLSICWEHEGIVRIVELDKLVARILSSASHPQDCKELISSVYEIARSKKVSKS